MNTQNPYKIVVVGGGFAGIAAVKTLQKRHLNAEITLVSKSDTFQYYPALYRLVTGALPIEVSLPLKTIFPTGVNLVIGRYESIDRQQNAITLADGTVLPYDYAVIALGSETNYFNIPGLAEHSFSFKSVAEALRLKQQLADVVARAKPLLAEGKKAQAVPLLHAPPGARRRSDAGPILYALDGVESLDDPRIWRCDAELADIEHQSPLLPTAAHMAPGEP